MFCEFCSRHVPRCGVCGRNDKLPPASERNARFWVYLENGRGGCWVKLTLKPTQTLKHAISYRTEEGYNAEWCRWYLVGGVVAWSWAQWGADCDGDISAGGLLTCPVEALADTDTAGILVPAWKVADYYQRDEIAEAAGY